MSRTKDLKKFHKMIHHDTEEQTARRLANFKAMEEKEIEKKELEDKGWARIIINDTPTEEEIIETMEEPIEEEITLEEQIDVIKQVKGEINSKVEELMPGKVQCPECKEWFAKGGAFATHYKSHFNGTT